MKGHESLHDAMSERFVSDPREIVKSGDVVRVKVLEVDEARNRISLTLRLDDEVGAANPERAPRRDGKDRADRPDRNDRGERTGGARDNRDNRGRKDTRARGDRSGGSSPSNSAMADALRRAGLTGK